ncbi:YIEGIA domain-containing protein [Ammoniphilus resinae]|uniref:Membrane protein YeaQ/YmgE (Transglycosylase-associated protein family) n=1 Tax=Ammoniphilus resinae TaxID=861532 RepID=A0ABS4GLG4_9BACL|nr:YIEGIA domain-containing protein [Ammoniphilus resinae]MBP1931115.1 putative membrane protein YeaQ/YmgE (transglycosylase-associated protein family) [Ammoniphilus resinae]
MGDGMLSKEYIIVIVTATIVGTLARLFSLKADLRQYPSYPNGYLINLFVGFIAAAVGAVALPALLTKNFTAITFLTVAIQQFRDVRKAERDSLKDLENTEFTKRGDAYIDGIAKTFEARNYISLIVSFMTAITMLLVKTKMVTLEILIGAIVGFIVFYLIKRYSKGKSIGDIADVREGKIEVRDSELFVDDLYVTNLLGTENGQNLFQKEGIAVVIYPRERHFSIALDNFGQRQAILFDAARALGVKRYSFTRKEYAEGRIIITFVPIIHDVNKLIESVKNTPLLESVKKSHSVMQTNLVGKE